MGGMIMEKVNRWIAKHPKLAGMLIGIVMVFVGTWWLSMGVPGWITYPFLVVATVSVVLWTGTAGARLLKEPLKCLKEQCDPYPYMEEINVQREYPGNGTAKQLRDIDYAMTLRCIGKYEQAYALLTQINIDKHGGMIPAYKVIYYNNIMDLCTLMGKYHEAVIWYEKLRKLFDDLKPGKQKEQLRKTVDSNLAAYYFCKGEYDQTLHTLSQAKPENLSERIENAMMYARTYLAMGETEKAKNPLQFVAENSNKLYFAIEARELLVKINMEEQ